MNNPDEKSAVEQFGKGDKYIGVATLLATLPGLPMFGHGQFEGFAEKYGMEFRRATMDEQPDEWLIERHEREIVPLLHRRGDFAEARDFLLYDFASDGGGVDEHVFAYSNGTGPSRSLVVYHNRYAETSGWIRDSAGVRAQGGRRVEGDWCGGRWPTGSGWPTGRRTADGSRCASSGRASSTCARSPRSASAACTSRFAPTRPACSGSCASCTTRPASGAGWRSGSADAACLARGRAARAPARAGPRRAAGGDRRAARPAVERLVARRGRCHRHRAATGPRRSRRVAGAGRARRAGRDDDRRRFAGGGASGVGAAPAAGVAALGCSRRGDEPGVVRGAAARAGRRRRAAGAAASTRRPPGGPPSASGCCSTCRCPRPSAGAPDGLPLRLVDAWLADPVVRSFLRVNRWDDAEWFHRESWLELVAWTDRLERVLTPPEARVRRPGRAVGPASGGWRRPARRPAIASTACARRWRRAPRPGRRPRGGRASRLPKATGLPPGPKGGASAAPKPDAGKDGPPSG